MGAKRAEPGESDRAGRIDKGDERSVPDDGISVCVNCGSRLGPDSFAGYIINAVGLAMFRLCPQCRAAADLRMLQGIGWQAEERLLLTAPARGRA